MNNSKLAIESTPLEEEIKVDRTVYLREREAELIRIIEAVDGVMSSEEWSTLKSLVFDGLVPTLTKEIQTEARRDVPDTLKLNRLAGQLKWAEKYSDLGKLRDIFRIELTNIRKQLYGKEKE